MWLLFCAIIFGLPACTYRQNKTKIPSSNFLWTRSLCWNNKTNWFKKQASFSYHASSSHPNLQFRIPLQSRWVWMQVASSQSYSIWKNSDRLKCHIITVAFPFPFHWFSFCSRIKCHTITVAFPFHWFSFCKRIKCNTITVLVLTTKNLMSRNFQKLCCVSLICYNNNQRT